MLCRVTAGKPDSVDAAAFNSPANQRFACCSRSLIYECTLLSALAPCVPPRFNVPQPNWSGRVVSAVGFKPLIPRLKGFQRVWCHLSAHGFASATHNSKTLKSSQNSLLIQDKVGVRTFLTRQTSDCKYLTSLWM